VEEVTLLVWAFDALLAAGLVWLAWRVVSARNLFKAVVLFVSVGLLVSLVWMRLNAPDVALAEAAIGAGLTGALLMSALGRLGRSAGDDEEEAQ
jgi:uncharacterized MnhB-related membrane protein